MGGLYPPPRFAESNSAAFMTVKHFVVLARHALH